MQIGQGRGFGGKCFVQIHAGGKTFAVAAEQNGADRGIALGLRESQRQIAAEGGVQGVPLPGAVQRQAQFRRNCGRACDPADCRSQSVAARR